MRDFGQGASQPVHARRRPQPSRPINRDSAPVDHYFRGGGGGAIQERPLHTGAAGGGGAPGGGSSLDALVQRIKQLAPQAQPPSFGRDSAPMQGPPVGAGAAGPLDASQDIPQHGSAGMGQHRMEEPHDAALAYAMHRIQQMIQEHVLSPEQGQFDDPKRAWRELSAGQGPGGHALMGAAGQHGFKDVGAFLDQGGQDHRYQYSPGTSNHPAYPEPSSTGMGQHRMDEPGIDDPAFHEALLSSFAEGAGGGYGEMDGAGGGTLDALLASLGLKPPAPRRRPVLRQPGYDLLGQFDQRNPPPYG